MDPKGPRPPGLLKRESETEPLPDDRVDDDLAAIQYNPEETDVEDYTYCKLDKPGEMIRLLRVMAGITDQDPIRCELIDAVFEGGQACDPDPETKRPLEYEALSWCWGTENDFKYQIHIDEDGTLYRHKTSKNLITALRCLRYRSKPRLIWVDAVCIDLGDIEERNEQVRRMAHIYSCATQVCVWLGRDDPNSIIAIPFIKDEIRPLQNFDTLCGDVYIDKWRSFFMLLQRDWFSRRWVVQEISLARQAEIYCGKDQMSWNDFSHAVELFVDFETTTHRLSRVIKSVDRAMAHWFDHMHALPANSLVQATRMLFQNDSKIEMSQDNPQGLIPRPLLSLEHLVSILTLFGNARAHDTIYALLAIAKDAVAVVNSTADSQSDSTTANRIPGQDLQTDSTNAFRFPGQHGFLVNYNRPYVDVCKDFIEFSIKHSDPHCALDIICRPWAPKVKPKETSVSEPSNDQRPRKRVRKTQSSLGQEEARVSSLGAVNDASTHLSPSQSDKLLNEYFLLDSSSGSRPDYQSKRLDMFNSKTESIPLPSWVSPLEGAPFRMSPAGIDTEPNAQRMVRKNADLLVGMPGNGQRRYNAAQGALIHKESLYFRKRMFQEINHFSMYIRGFEIDTVEEFRSPCQNGIITKEWTDLAGWKVGDESLTEVPSEFWRTIIANRGNDGQPAPQYYARACEQAVRRGGGQLDTRELINEDQNYIVSQFCRRVQETVWNRCLIKTKSGKLGLAKDGVARGDIVCILYGCSVPVILKLREKTDDQVTRERAEDMLAGLETAIKSYERSSNRKRKRVERQKAALERQSESGQYGHTVKRVKEWGKTEIRSYVQDWNNIGAELAKLRKEREEVDKKVKGFEREQKALRNQRDNTKADDGQKKRWYAFHGECYIHMMMDGEAMELKGEKDIPDKVFELR